MSRLLFYSLLVLLAACNSNTNTDLSSDTDLLLDASHGGGGAAWGLENCDACHAIAFIHQNEDGLREIVKDNGFDTCTGCHGSNGTKAQRQCIICHNDKDLPDAPIQSGRHKHDFVSTADNVLQDKQCLNCHYASDMDGLFEINRDLTRYPDAHGINSPYASGADFCLRCHNKNHQQADFPITDKVFDDPLIAIEDAYRLVDKHGEVDSAGTGTYAGLRTDYIYGSRVECTDCHAMHGTDNIKLIIDQSDKGSSKLDSVIRDLPHSVSISGEDYSQLCVLCHDMETLQNQGDVDTGNGLSGVHITGSSCIECHSHGEAVQAGL
ncbi:MAG: hypothetical protein GQ573_03635 [Gammaproteobacteria bacterium]|nr:hypothetical protein [Gammaproteobacteria bacterium]